MQTEPSSPHCTGRRGLLLGVGALAAAPWSPVLAVDAPNEAQAFAAHDFPDALRALGGVPRPSTEVILELPDIAEDGAVVPIKVTSRLPGTREILVIVDGNPQPLAVRFSIPGGTDAFVATRIRMAASGTVYAAARTDDGLYACARKVQVQVGGCG